MYKNTYKTYKLRIAVVKQTITNYLTWWASFICTIITFRRISVACSSTICFMSYDPSCSQSCSITTRRAAATPRVKLTPYAIDRNLDGI